MAGREEEARAKVKEILRLRFSFSPELTGVAPVKDPAAGKPMLDALRKAWLKEGGRLALSGHKETTDLSVARLWLDASL